MIKRITAIIMTIIICCGVFVMPVYAVDYSTMESGFENIDLDELTDEELEALYENPYFMEWYQQTIGGTSTYGTVNLSMVEMDGMKFYIPIYSPALTNITALLSNDNKTINIYYTTSPAEDVRRYNSYLYFETKGLTYRTTIANNEATEEAAINIIYNLIFNGIDEFGNKAYTNLIKYKDETTDFDGSDATYTSKVIIYTTSMATTTNSKGQNSSYLKELSFAYDYYKTMDIYTPEGNTGGNTEDGGNTGGDSGNTGGDNTDGDSGNTGGDNDNSGILGWLEDIWEGITSIPEKLGEVISTVSGYLEDILEGLSLRGILDSLGIMSNGEFLMTIGNNIAEKMDGNQFYTSLIYIKNELVEIFGADYDSYRGFVNTHPFRLTLRKTVNPNGFGETSSDSFEHFGYNEIDYGVNNMSIIGDMKWFFGTSENNNNTVVNTYHWANADGSPAVKYYSDLIIGAFMWVAFAYYLWLRLPDLISGDLISITHSAGNEIRDAKPTEYKTLTYDNNTGEVLRNTTTRKEKKR